MTKYVPAPVLAGLLLLGLVARATVSLANEVEIVKTRFEKQGDTWAVDTTLLHEDTGWDHYADKWRVVDAKGNVLGERILFHPHETEQPFTRSQSGIRIPAETKIVYVEAHDKVHGWSKQRVRVNLGHKSGDRYTVE